MANQSFPNYGTWGIMKLIGFIGNYGNYKMGTGVMVHVRNYNYVHNCREGRDLLGIMGIVNIKGHIDR